MASKSWNMLEKVYFTQFYRYSRDWYSFDVFEINKWMILYIDWLIFYLINYLMDLLVDWLIDWLIDISTDSLIDCWLIDWLIYQLIHWLTVDWLTNWLINWLIDCLIDWLMGTVHCTCWSLCKCMHRTPSPKFSKIASWGLQSLISCLKNFFSWLKEKRNI